MRKSLTILSTLLFISLSSVAQSVEVKSEQQKINEDKTDGFSTTIEGNVDDILSNWTKYLRTLGRLRGRGSYSEVSDFSIEEQIFEDSTLYAIEMSDETTVTVWLGSSVEDTDDYSISEYLKTSVYDFGIKYYRHVAQEKIDEAEKAVQITERRHGRLVRDSVEYANKLSSAQNEIIRLKQLIEKNELESTVMIERLDQNKNDRDSIQLEIVKMLKIVEDRKKEKNMIE